MTTATSYVVATRNLRLDHLDQLNSGKIKIYSGAVPATADASLGAAVLMATPTFGATAFGAAVAGVKTANAITQDSSAAGDTNPATFARLTKSDDTVIVQLTVGGTAQATTGGLQLATSSITVGQIVQLSSLAITEAG